MAPSHYLNKYELIIKGVLWHTQKNIFIESDQDVNSFAKSEIYTCK